MKTVCVVHGVGFFDDIANATISKFADNFAAKTGAKTVLYNWNHPGEFPEDDRHTPFFRDMRDFVFQVIMDFSYVCRHFDDIAVTMPDADMYIGHSAGGVIVYSRKNKPAVIMGCPVQLVQNVGLCKGITAPVLNVLHYRDPIAAMTSVATNTIIYDPLVSVWLNPVKAHTGYWTSKAFMTQCVDWFNLYVKE